jgi:hypothetical protein
VPEKSLIDVGLVAVVIAELRIFDGFFVTCEKLR